MDRLYIALSHCWGLTIPDAGRTTLGRRNMSIFAGNLPRTFQDFIEIARRLEIRYVWIDSLCIIQDSGDDWEKEAAQMASIYSNAHLTIAASGHCCDSTYTPVRTRRMHSITSGVCQALWHGFVD